MSENRNTNMVVLVAQYGDGSGEPEIVGIFWTREKAEAALRMIERADPMKTIYVLEGELHSS